jgi:hypothetical protein
MKLKEKINIYFIAAFLTIVASLIGIFTGVLHILERIGYIDWNYFEKYISPIWKNIEDNLWFFLNIVISVISATVLKIVVKNFNIVVGKFSRVQKWLKNIYTINMLEKKIQDIHKKSNEDIEAQTQLLSEELEKAKNYNEKMKEELEEQQELFKKELEKHKEFEKTLEDDGKKNQIKFNTSFRFLSRLYRKQAEEHLDKGDFHEFFYYMHIFYKCLIEINLLDNYDKGRLERTYSLLSKKETNDMIPLKNKSNICWFVLHLLNFIRRCKRNGSEDDYLIRACLIYKILFEFTFTCDGSTLTYSDIKEGLRVRMKNDGDNKYKETDIEDILALADSYYSEKA